MKRASYRDAIDMIAHNDEPTELDVESIRTYTTTQLVAEIFGATDHKVARDILRLRERRDRAERARPGR